MSTSTFDLPTTKSDPRNQRSWTRVLALKETRQLLPLATVLIAVGFLIHGIVATSSRNFVEAGALHKIVAVLIPCLFAIGVGAVSASQEREQRTIFWLSALPIPHRWILATKFTVGLAGLVVMWLLSGLLGRCFTSELFVDYPTDFGSFFTILINTFYLLVVGFASAWLFENAMVALAMIVPLAAIPTLAMAIEQQISGENRLPDSVIFVNYLLAGLVVGWIGWHAGINCLAPKAKSNRFRRWSESLPRRAPRNAFLNAPQSASLSLVWQFARQNRLLPIAAVGLALLAFVGLRTNFPSVIAAWLLLCWLGASVFQSDSSRQRIRFLAERGVSPGLVWWTRQMLPASVVVIGMLLLALMFTFPPRAAMAISWFRHERGAPWIALGSLAMLVLHAASQWQAQLIRSPIVALIAAPAVGAGAISFTAFAVVSLGAPLWLVFLSCVIAFFATRVMTQPWMDGRMGLKFWLTHLGFAALAGGILIVPLIVTLLTVPSVPRSDWPKFEAALTQFQAEASQVRTLPEPRELVVRRNQDAAITFTDVAEVAMMGSDSEPLTTEEPQSSGREGGRPPGQVPPLQVSLVDGRQELFNELQRQVDEAPGAVRGSSAIAVVTGEVVLSALQLEEAPDNVAAQTRYRSAVSLLGQIVKKLRLSWRLIDQHTAENVEQFLVKQLKATNARTWLTESRFRELAQQLADRDGRNFARKRAVVLSGVYLGGTDIGGIEFEPSGWPSDLRGSIATHRRRWRIVWQLLQYSESKDPVEANQRFRELTALWGGTASTSQGQSQIPGNAWHGLWETEAELLLKQ